jgi:hypothetical protein
MVHFLIHFCVDEGMPFRLYYIVLKNYLPPHPFFLSVFLYQKFDKIFQKFSKINQIYTRKKEIKKKIPPILLNKNSLVVPTPNHKSCVGREREKRE